MAVAKLNYSVNNVGMIDSYDRSSVRDNLQQVQLTFEIYMQALIKAQAEKIVNN